MKSLVLRVRIFIVILASVLIAGTIGFMILEDIAPSDALYFTVVTIATVGYGDIAPVTSGGKALASILIIAGVGSFSGFIVNGTHLLIERRQEHVRLERLNMLMSLFFSEMGTDLLKDFISLDPDIETFRSELVIDNSWTDEKFADLAARLRNHSFNIQHRCESFEALRSYLSQKGELLVRLIENPTLNERGFFTEALRATLHLRSELVLRENLCGLPDSDLEHLANDARRAYAALTGEWVQYMRYLKGKYPYLFSLALRTSPFSKNVSVVVDNTLRPVDR